MRETPEDDTVWFHVEPNTLYEIVHEEECGVTELPVSMCGCRKHRGKPAPADPFESVNEDAPRQGPGPWFTASYPGECSGCGFEYNEGVIIRADGSGGWEAEECCG